MDLRQEDLGDNPGRIDLSYPQGLRMPTGNKHGANDLWLPGWYTSGRIPEGVVDQIQPGQYTIVPIQRDGGNFMVIFDQANEQIILSNGRYYLRSAIGHFVPEFIEIEISKEDAEKVDIALDAQGPSSQFSGQLHSDFYGKSGFVVAGTKDIRYHGEPEQEIVPYVLLNELQPGFLDGATGVYHTPKGYYVDEAVVEEFDRSFPPKEKLKLSGQLFCGKKPLKSWAAVIKKRALLKRGARQVVKTEIRLWYFCGQIRNRRSENCGNFQFWWT